MKGYNINQERAEELKRNGYPVLLCPDTGFWLRTDEITKQDLTHHIYRTGDKEQQVPETAWPY